MIPEVRLEAHRRSGFKGRENETQVKTSRQGTRDEKKKRNPKNSMTVGNVEEQTKEQN